MELKTVIQWLLDNNYGVLINGEFVQTEKLNKELTNRAPTIVVQTAAETVRVSVPPKSIIAIEDKKELWNKFIADAEIPFRVGSTTGGQYTVRMYSKPAVDKLIEILRKPKVDYKILVASTKNYYATVAYKILLSKYLLNDVWQDEYEHYLRGKPMVQPGDNRFED